MVTNTPCHVSKDDDERTLLSFAAKAAGIVGYRYVTPDVEHRLLTDRGVAVWNPLKDDGDALRLAVRLGIEYVYGYGLDDEVQRVIVYDDLHVMVQDGDVCAATRLAIVRAAAEIGKAMK